MTDSRFIQILWVYVGVTLASMVATFFPTYSDALADAYTNEPETWLLKNLWLAGLVLVPLLFAGLAGIVGLFFFKRWARTLSLSLTLTGLVITGFLGPSLSSGLEASLLEASFILWGVILALSYFSSVSARFER